MEMRSKLTQSHSHTEATENGSPSAPVLRLGVQLTFKKGGLRLRFPLSSHRSAGLHLTDTILRVDLMRFHVGALWLFCFPVMSPVIEVAKTCMYTGGIFMSRSETAYVCTSSSGELG